MKIDQSTASNLYATIWEYYEDQQLILDVVLEEAIRLMPINRTVGTTSMSKMALSEEEAKELLHHQVVHLKLSDQYQEIIRRLEHISSEKLKHSTSLPILSLQERFELDELDFRVLLVLLAPHLNKKYMKLYAYLQDDMTRQNVTLDLLISLCARTSQEVQALYYRYYYLNDKYAMLYEEGEKQAILFQESSILIKPLRLKERVVHYLLLDASAQYRFPFDIKATRYNPQALTTELLVDHEKQRNMQHIADSYQNQQVGFCLIGTTGSGKMTHTILLAEHAGASVLHVDVTTLPLVRADFQQGLTEVLFDATITNSLLVLDRLEQLVISNDSRLEWLQSLSQQFSGMICFHTEQPLTLSSMNIPIFNYSLEIPSIDERTSLWLHFASARLPINTSQALELANKFQFSPGQIKKVLQLAQLAKIQQDNKESILEFTQQSTQDMKLIHESAYGIIHHGLDEKASKLKVSWSWEDLILPPDVMQLLQQACYRINHRYTVMQDWGFSRLLPYGRGVSMLFTGPPGTGKTMAASVMAKQLQCELYRVDLTRIVSKYIGETEKNLAEVFDRAKLSGAILFFDEADALFGKRSEVKDSHDKYANMETSYLLQKMEEYEGLTILATNFSQNLDEAFIRRIQYIVKFPFPTIEQREQLWRSVVPKQMPCEELDYQFLAKTFELSGGPIKNIVLTAAYMAASDTGIVSMKHMIEAAIQEYKKTGKLLMKERLGSYSEYWKG